MKIAVFGVGGVGGYFGARLAQAGEDVTFIARGDHLHAIQDNGLRVESILGDFVIQPAKAEEDPARVGVVDLVILGVKAWQVSEVAGSLKPLVGKQTMVLPLQNGVEAPYQLAEVLGREHVLGGLCRISVFIASPGVIRHVAIPPSLMFGELDSRKSSRVVDLLGVFSQCQGLAAGIPEDVNVALWEKFIFITAVSGLGAAVRLPIGAYRGIPETRKLLMGALKEAVFVGRANQVNITDEIMDHTLQVIDGLPPETFASMQNDIMNGRPSELEYQTGTIVRMGMELSVPTPINDFLYAVLLPMERKARVTRAE